MIQKNWDTINRLIEVVKELKSYNDSLGQIEVVTPGVRTSVRSWNTASTLQVNGQCNCSVPTLDTAGTLQIFQANFYAIFQGQGIFSTF